MYRVLIISFANWDSLAELPAVLKSAGCTVDVYCGKDSWVLKNEFYDNWIEAPSLKDDEFVKNVIDLVQKEPDKYNWVIAGDDVIIRLLNDAISDEQLFHKMLPMCKMENRELLGSKAGFSNLCAKYNISTPRFMIYQPGMSVKQIADYMKFPLMMKTDRSEAGTGVFKCNNEAELAEELNKLENKENVVFQQFIEGYDINMEVLFKDGELMAYSYAKLLKILGKFGLSTQRMFIQKPEIEPDLRKIGSALGINGFASIAFMYSEKEDTHYLIEVDVRPNSWIYYGKFTGSDFGEAIRRISKGDLTTVRPDPAKFPNEIKVCLYKKDMMRAIVQKDLNGLRYWFNNVEESKRFIPSYDKTLLKATNDYLWWFFKELVREKISRTLGGKRSS